MYDAVWTAAFALDDVERQLRAGVLEGVSSLRDFSYDGNPGINQQIFNSAKQRSFIGVTVIVGRGGGGLLCKVLINFCHSCRAMCPSMSLEIESPKEKSINIVR